VNDLDTAPITAEDELGVLSELTTGRTEPTPAGGRPRRQSMFGGHVPEHGRPRGGAAWLVRASLLLAGVLLIGTAFIASYVGALHEPHPRDVPIGTVEGDTGAQALVAGLGEASPFALTVYPDGAAADRALAERRVYAVLDTDPVADGLRLTLAGGAAPGVADLIRQALGAAATTARIPLSVRDTHPPAGRDPRGLTPFYLVVGWLLGGYLAATALAVIVGTVPRNGPRLGMRLGAFAVFAVLLGLAGALITGPVYGIWSHHLVALCSAGTLVVFTSAAVTAALESWIGLAGTGLAMLLLFIVGNPGSGGVYPPEFLPGLFRDLHRWIPTGQATELVRAIEYFGGQAIARPATGLAAWAAASLLAVLGATLTVGPRKPRRPDPPVEPVLPPEPAASPEPAGPGGAAKPAETAAG
jgi:hypothetical protein